jgi:hypothetical protein
MQIKNKISVFLIINVTLLLFGMQKLFSQDYYNYLDVESSVTTFNLNTVAELETEQVQTNAFTITIRSRFDNFNVYASIYSNYSSTGYVASSNGLAIKLRSVSPSRTANFNKVPITGSNQLIIQSTRTNNSSVVYTYDMYVGPVGFDIPPGSFNATILFTMTQP